MLIMCYALIKAMGEDADQAPELQPGYVSPKLAARRAARAGVAPAGAGAVAAGRPRMAGGAPELTEEEA
jgi:hypothetical protein